MNFARFSILVALLYLLASCINDGNLYIPFKGTVKTYPLAISTNPSQYYGNVTFAELEDSSTLVRILFDSLKNLTHQPYPVAILEDNAVEGNQIVSYLNAIGENKQTSKTSVNELLGKSITFSQMVGLDGHIKVFNSDTIKVLYQTDIGQNALTKNSIVYNVSKRNGFLFSGNARFAERMNGETQVLFRLSGVVFGQKYKVYLMGGSVENPKQDTIAFLGNLLGNNSNFYFINIPKEKNGTILNYQELQKLDAHLTFNLNNNIVSSSNIGINAK